MCAGAATSASWAAERNAVVEGVEDRALREAVQRAVGESRAAPASRIEARRRAVEAADNATALLHSEGYWQSSVEPDIGEGDAPTPVITVDLGPRFHLSQIGVEWVGTPPSPEARDVALKGLSLKPGMPARNADVIAAQGRIVSLLQAEGYADASAPPPVPIVDHADRTMRPTFQIAAGPLVKLGRVRVETKGRTNPAWVDYLAPWRPGYTYKPELVAELERRLLDTAIYDSVTVALSATPDADGLRPVIVSLADRPRHSIEVGAGYSVISSPNTEVSITPGTIYSTGEGPDFSVRWSEFNRLHRADTLTVEARYARIDSRLGVDLTLPHWRSPGLVLKATLEGFRQDTAAYEQQGAAIRADLTRRYGKTSYFTRGFSLVKSTVDDKHTGTLDIFTLAALGAIALDHSDNPLDPHRGWKAEVRLEPTLITGEESLAYVRAQVQGTYYVPIGVQANTVLAARVRVGSILGGTLPGVPAANRFYAGGGGSVRGYEYQSVGPRYSDGVPQGGLSLFESSFEARHRFTNFLNGKFGAAVFVDAGSVGKHLQPDFTALRYAVGVGIRYDLGFAPIRVDVATPLKKFSGDSPFQVYLSIGQSF